MPDKSSRREVLTMGVAAVASLTPMANAQPSVPARAPVAPDDLAAVQAQLAAPLSEEAKKLMTRAIAYNRGNTTQRLKIKLPEGTEPCFDYIPMPKEQRTR